jgi:hypothetical protein
MLLALASGGGLSGDCLSLLFPAASQFLVALGPQNLSVTIPLGLPIIWPKVERNCAQTRMREQNDGRVTR